MTTSSTRRRTRSVLVAAAVLAGGLTAATSAQAGAPATSVTTSAEEYWACLAVRQVDVGVCLKNPYPDLSGVQTLRTRIRNLTGI